MNDRYIYQKPPKNNRYGAFRRRLKSLILFAVVILVIGLFIYANLNHSPKSQPQTSTLTNSTIGDNSTTYTSPYFKFEDTGNAKWVLEKDRSTSSTFIYVKYLGQTNLATIIISVNADQYMGNGFTRVLPVRIVNNSSFEATGVSDPCVSQYSVGEPHIIKEIDYQGTKMFCNAGDTQYTVVVGEIGGDFNMNMKSSIGAPLHIEITYKANGVTPDPDSLINVVKTFQTI